MDEAIRKQLEGLLAYGRIAPSDAALLFAKAYEVRFSGGLIIQSAQTGRCSVLFESGIAAQFRSTKQLGVVLSELGDVLPPEQIEFVRKHAQNHGIDELSALRRLHLLPDLTLRRLQQQCMLRSIAELGSSATALDFQFENNPEVSPQAEGFKAPVEPLLCIAELLGKCRDISRYREVVLSIKQNLLRPLNAHLPNDLPMTTRQVLLALRREAVAFETLRLRRVAPEEVLVPAVWALLATGWLVSEARTVMSVQPKAPFSLPPRTDRSPASRVPPASTVRPRAIQEVPTNLRSVEPPASRAPATMSHAPPSSRGGDEMSVESATLDAWMRAVADPSCCERALRIAERAGARFPTNPRILFYLGVLQAKCGFGEEGEHTLRRVVKLDPEHTEAQKELLILRKRNSAHSQTRPTALLDRLGSRKSS